MKYLATAKVKDRLAKAERIAVFLDFDGTLVPLAPAPSQIRVPRRLHSLLEKLAANDGVTVGIISGRRLTDLVRYVHAPDTIPMAGSHGLEWIIHGKKGKAPLPRGYKKALRSLYMATTVLARTAPGLTAEWKGLSMSIHLRGVPPSDLAYIRKGVISMIAKANTHGLFQVIPGKTDIDIRPDIIWTKAEVVRHILGELGVNADTTTFVYIGDDTTDEDVFRAFPRSVTVHVGRSRKTQANYYLYNVAGVYEFLQYLVKNRV